MQLTTVIGIFIGVGGILIGHLIEGGRASSLVQFAAFFIVFGGTLGATLVANTFENIRIMGQLIQEMLEHRGEREAKLIADDIVMASKIARKESILHLEKKINTFRSSYMRKIFKYVVDGVEPTVIRDIFETEIDSTEQKKMNGANVLMDAGGFAPTIGIIGAVLGLIHVMANLTDTSELGKGIAVAFVATIYGVGSANLIFIPLANKLKRMIQEESERKQMIVEGAIGIVMGLNPYLVEEKMTSFSESQKAL